MIDRLSIYGHYGSHNHGNEAIVRGLYELFKHKGITLYSYMPETDIKYELDEICKINPFMRAYKRYTPERLFLAIISRLINNQRLIRSYRLKPFFKFIEGIYLLEAGDQYCEDEGLRSFYAYTNEEIINRGGKTVMLPCTIAEESFTNPKLIEDLKRYSMIFARESITYNALINAGLRDTSYYAPCPAFIMKPRTCQLPDIFSERPIVGLTIGLLAQGKERYTNAVLENSRTLISYIINNTDFAIALIPHVNVGKSLTDIIPMHNLYNEFKDTHRIVEISEKRADEQKYIISNCRFIVTLRTHVSIAAYSSCIPTLVIGYSQKSKGIAKDLFGTSENYVVGVESFNANDKLVKAFEWLLKNEIEIRAKLKEVLPAYIDKVKIINEKIARLAGV